MRFLADIVFSARFAGSTGLFLHDHHSPDAGQAGDRVIVSGLQRIRPGIKARAISSSQENASTESKQ